MEPCVKCIITDERYGRLRALLAADPEWHDGEIVWSEKA